MLWELLCGFIVIAALVFEWARRYHSVRIIEAWRRGLVEDDEELFRQPPPRDDCPVCFLRLPMIHEQKYQPCCGKTICCGCMDAVQQRANVSAPICPFCRAPCINDEVLRQLKVRASMKDANAIGLLGRFQANGEYGIPRDTKKGIEMLSIAARLGNVSACGLLGNFYHPYFISIPGVDKDYEKAIHYYELAAMGGLEEARTNLGCLLILQSKESNRFKKYYMIMVAMTHFLIAAAQGYDEALKLVKDGYVQGFITKDEFAQALRAHKDSKK